MKLALIGFGNIATVLLEELAKSPIAPLDSLTVLSRAGSAGATRAALQERFGGVATSWSVVSDLAGLLAAAPDLVVECAGHSAVSDNLPGVLEHGIDAVLVSIGALADEALKARLEEAAAKGKARLILPAGAIGGIDLLSALKPAGGLNVTYRGTKPPLAWKGTPAEDLLDLEGMTEARVFFTGTAREAAQAYPKNANVAATLALAGAGFEATKVELVADPAAKGNSHACEVRSPVAEYRMDIQNLPSTGNAKTSVSTIFSVLREIRNRIGPVAI